MVWKIVRRKFTALKYERGSPQRYQLNKNSLTSEFARKKVWLVTDENNKPLKSFESINEAQDFIQNPKKFSFNTNVKKYTPQDMKRTQAYLSAKKTFIKKSLGNY
jgi:hypothetical protein